MYVCIYVFLYYPEFNDLNFTYPLRFQKFKNKGDLGFFFVDHTFFLWLVLNDQVLRNKPKMQLSHLHWNKFLRGGTNLSYEL